MRYERNNKGFDELAVSPEVHRYIHEVAERYTDVVRTYAPIGGRGDSHPGRYRDSLHADTKIVHLPHGPRWAALIVAPVPYAAALEYGSVRVPNPPRPLTKLLDIVDAADPNTARKAARRRQG